MNPAEAHILAPWSPATDPHRRQETAWAWSLAEADWPVKLVACPGPTDYETAVREAWTGTLLIWEQDIVPIAGQVAALWACPYPVCAQAYPLYRPGPEHPAWRALAATANTLSPELQEQVALWRSLPAARLSLLPGAAGHLPVCAHRIGPPGTTRWIRPGHEWATHAGLGLTKFATTRLSQALDWEPGDWTDLDNRVSRWLFRHRVGIHIHWGLAAHHHHCPCHPDGKAPPVPNSSVS